MTSLQEPNIQGVTITTYSRSWFWKSWLFQYLVCIKAVNAMPVYILMSAAGLAEGKTSEQQSPCIHLSYTEVQDCDIPVVLW